MRKISLFATGLLLGHTFIRKIKPVAALCRRVFVLRRPAGVFATVEGDAFNMA
jgi:hypothetical protein